MIVASNAGRDNHPAWFHNLQANPETVIETPGDDEVQTVKVKARVAGDTERDALYAEVVAKAPQFGEYQKGTSRRIPIVVLEPAPPSGTSGTAAARCAAAGRRAAPSAGARRRVPYGPL